MMMVDMSREEYMQEVFRRKMALDLVTDWLGEEKGGGV